MRVPRPRWIAGGLLALLVAYGCYSSVAPPFDVDAIEHPDDVDLPVEDTGPDACAPRKPWEGPGVTGVLPITATDALVLSGDRYFKAEFDTRPGDAADPQVGRLVAWGESGALSDLWGNAPPVLGQEPWEQQGVTSAYVQKGGGAQIIISRYLRWNKEGDQWPSPGSIVDDWLINDAAPPDIDGAVPWTGPGVTAAYFRPGEATFVAMSQDKGWVRNTSDPDPKNWTWQSAFNLAEAGPYSSAPPVAGQRPWEGKGVTAAWYIGSKYFLVSVDRMWIHDGRGWASSGMLKDLPIWSSAPTAPCSR